MLSNPKIINLTNYAIKKSIEEIDKIKKEKEVIKSECKKTAKEGIYLISEIILNEGITDEFLDDMLEMIRIYKEEK